MKISYAVALLVILAGISTGEAKPGWRDDLKAALSAHEQATTFESELLALNKFEDTCKRHDQEWLPHYWTAYMFTQVARLEKMQAQAKNPSPYLDKAQKYLDTAAALIPEKTGTLNSDILALQVLIYNFRAWFNAESADQFRELAKGSFLEAVKGNAENPLLYVLSGTGLIGEGAEEKNPGKVFAGKVLLLEAQRKFNETKDPRFMTTHWNEEWLPFWLPRAEKLLSGLNES